MNFKKLTIEAQKGNIKPADFVKMFGLLKKYNSGNKFRELFRGLYEIYLKSPYWKAKRKEIVKLQGGICNKCDNYISDVHHKTYKNIGNENLEDLEGLCRYCHKVKHVDLPMMKLGDIVDKVLARNDLRIGR
jgi:hypothetical protein